jgi:chromatin modification-related protein YNG2
MIGCDSDACPFEWFHLSCVGVTKPLPTTWYCNTCKERMAREEKEGAARAPDKGNKRKRKKE